FRGDKPPGDPGHHRERLSVLLENCAGMMRHSQYSPSQQLRLFGRSWDLDNQDPEYLFTLIDPPVWYPGRALDQGVLPDRSLLFTDLHGTGSLQNIEDHINGSLVPL